MSEEIREGIDATLLEDFEEVKDDGKQISDRKDKKDDKDGPSYDEASRSSIDSNPESVGGVSSLSLEDQGSEKQDNGDAPSTRGMPSLPFNSNNNRLLGSPPGSGPGPCGNCIPLSTAPNDHLCPFCTSSRNETDEPIPVSPLEGLDPACGTT